MRFAVIYSGYLGNIKRCFGSLKKYLFTSVDEVDVYIVTRNISVNVIKYMNKQSLRNIIYKKVNGYTIDEIKECVGYPVVSIVEWEKNSRLVNEYSIELEKFLDRTRNYEYKNPRVLNYDKEEKVFPKSSIGSIYEQYFMVSIGVNSMKVSGRKYDYVVRFRDRVVLSTRINNSLLNPNKLFLLGWKSDIYICEALVIGTPENVYSLFDGFHRKICGYRSEKAADPKISDTDNTFSGECQFALRVYSIFKEEDLIFSKLIVKHEVVSYKNQDFGPSIESSDLTEDMSECEWRIYNSVML